MEHRLPVGLCIEGNKRSRKRFVKVGELAETRECRFDKVREIRFKSRFFFLLGFRRRPGRFFRFFLIFAKDLLRKWEVNIPFRVEFDGESIGSIVRARRDLQQRDIARFVSKNVSKRKSATLKKYGGKLKNGGPIFFVECVE